MCKWAHRVLYGGLTGLFDTLYLFERRSGVRDSAVTVGATVIVSRDNGLATVSVSDSLNKHCARLDTRVLSSLLLL